MDPAARMVVRSGTAMSISEGNAPSSTRLKLMSTDLMPNRYTPGEAEVPEREAELIKRRDSVLAASYRLQYRRPVHFVRGEGMWLYDPDGRRYLDFYNNVPCVGHCHPEVNAAMAKQAGLINANTRYLEPKLVNCGFRRSRPGIPINHRPPIPISFRPGFRFEAGHLGRSPGSVLMFGLRFGSGQA